MADKGKEASKDDSKEAPKTHTSPLLAPKRAVEEAATKDHESLKKDLGSKILVIGLVILGVLAALYMGYRYLGGSSTDGSQTIGLAQGLFWAAVLMLMGLLALKFIEKVKWVGRALIIGGVLILIFSLATSGIARLATNVINSFDNCAGYGDCGRRADDIPVIKGGTVVIGRGESETFYANGKVQLQNNNIGYCLDVSPQGRFDLDPEHGGRIVYIKAFSGETELVTVTALPAAEC